MADPVEWSIVQRIAADLATVTPGNGYNLDLSASGAVTTGGLALDGPWPRAVVDVIGGTSAREGQSLALSKYDTTLRLEVVILGATTDDTPSKRLQLILQAMYDVRKVLETDRTLNGNVYDTMVESFEVFGQEDLALGAGWAVSCVVWTHRHRTSAGA